MIPILYDKTGVNRIGLLSDCIKCEVLEERNGEFELTLIYPSNSELLEGLDKENIIATTILSVICEITMSVSLLHW